MKIILLSLGLLFVSCKTPNYEKIEMCFKIYKPSGRVVYKKDNVHLNHRGILIHSGKSGGIMFTGSGDQTTHLYWKPESPNYMGWQKIEPNAIDFEIIDCK